MKRTIPLLITALIGFLMILAEFVPGFSFASDLATQHFNVLAAIAFILGAGNFFRVHGEKVYKQQAGWGYSGIALAAFLTMLLAGLFKIGVTPRPGYTARLDSVANSAAIGVATLEVAEDGGGTLNLVVRGAEKNSKQPVLFSVAGGPEINIGEMALNDKGAGTLSLSGKPESEKPPADGQLPTLVFAVKTGAGEQTIKIPSDAECGVKVGSAVQGTLKRYSRWTGSHETNGSLFWYIYEYMFQPLQQMMFALLAFYVASAAFRAFRARNIESVLLLGTAFIILLGRTYVGTVLTSWLPDTGFWSYFQIPNLTGWIMAFLATAGGRAIMIGIALGVASTSLKVLLGIDRSYLGSDSK